VASVREYETLVKRCSSWSVEDLGDLLHEINGDHELAEGERSNLQQQVYRLIWDRAQPQFQASTPDSLPRRESN